MLSMTKPTKNTTDKTVTVIYSWKVKKGKEKEFIAWLHGVASDAFNFPGHLGITTLRPPNGQGIYHSILRFDTEKHLDNWINSPQRKRWIQKLDGIATKQKTKVSGLETWFDLPSMSTPPPKWKMVIIIAIGVYPLSLILGYYVSPHLLSLNIFIRSLLFPLIVPAALTYALVPFLTQHVFKKWLYTSKNTD